MWSILGFIHNAPKIHKHQQQFDFEFPKDEILFIELINDSSSQMMSSYAWIYFPNIQTSLDGRIINPIQIKR